jgi:hypothetical protein
MTTLVTPYFCHDGVIGDGNGIFGDESDFSQKIFSLVVFFASYVLAGNSFFLGSIFFISTSNFSNDESVTPVSAFHFDAGR